MPCETVWGEALPENEKEESEAITSDINNQLVSRQTARVIHGYDNEQEIGRIAAEKVAEGNIGGAILNEFIRGQ